MISTKILIEKLEMIHSSLCLGITWKANALDENSQQVCRDAFHLWLLTIWDLLPCELRSDKYSHLVQLYYQLARCDIFLLGSWLDDVDRALIALPSHQCLFLERFKGVQLGGTLQSSHIIVLLQCINDLTLQGARRALRTVLLFLSRLNLSLSIQDELEQEYIDDEVRLSTFSFPEDLVHDISNVLSDWFKEYKEDEEVTPRHGPGGIAMHGRQPLSRKYKMLGRDQRLEYCLSPDVDLFSPVALNPLERTAQVIFVPKSFKTYRTICMEPPTLQYWQQYYMQQLALFIDDHPVLSRHINLEKQEYSKIAAREASVTKKFATVDLSKASDSVSYALVKRVFRRTPLLRALIGTRSDNAVLPSGKTIALSKFAPMGSALCFPIECILFAAICEVSYCYARIPHRHYRVYGDDLIVDSRCIPNLLRILEKLAFLPNARKTHYLVTDNFRESCGGDYYLGEDVSPVRLSRKFCGFPQTRDQHRSLANFRAPDDPTDLIDLSNAFFSFGLKSARSCVLRHLMLKHPFLPFSVPYGMGIWSFRPDNFHLPRKWRRGEKCLVADLVITKSLPIKKGNEHIRIFEWYRRNGDIYDTISIERTQRCVVRKTSPLWLYHQEVQEMA